MKTFTFCLAALSGLSLFAAPRTQTYHAPGFGEVKLSCAEAGNWSFALASETTADAQLLKLTMTTPTPSQPPVFFIRFQQSGVRADHVWSPYDDRYMLYPTYWVGDGKYVSSLAYHTPILSVFADDGSNTLALACSEAKRRVQYGVAIGESTCILDCSFKFFTEPEAPRTNYTATIRLDTKPTFWADAVKSSSDWVSSVNGFVPCPVPEAAFDPLYSSWYAFWQDVHADEIEREMPQAYDLGMRTAILDDGWQKEKSITAYSATGDWMPVASRFPDMKAHVDAVHKAGMHYMLWLSVPYVGAESQAWNRFKDKFLFVEGTPPAAEGVLDPRFPEVREYLISTYERAIRDWGFDGLKLDFIDKFALEGTDPAVKENYKGRDIRELPVAVDTLMKDIVTRLSKIRPDILLEFRQQYMGPAIRQYGNMIRCTDCPADSDKIRKLIADLRLTSGSTAVHSDMLVWNPMETPERAARPILNSLFSVIQYSMVLDRIPPKHREVIRHWLKFTQEHRTTLLKSSFKPYHPELNYPQLEAESDTERIVALYSSPTPVTIDAQKPTYLINSTDTTQIPVQLTHAATVTTSDVFGKEVSTLSLPAGLHLIPIPISGLAQFNR